MFHWRETGYVAFMRRQPWPWRALAACLTLAFLAWLFSAHTYAYFSVIMLVLWAFFPEHLFRNSNRLSRVKNMPAMLHRTAGKPEDLLRVGMEEAPISAVKKVALSKYDDASAFIDFPYTSKFSQPLLFPIQQLESVRSWFVEQMPELEVIE